jgi:hypothetical protein
MYGSLHRTENLVSRPRILRANQIKDGEKQKSHERKAHEFHATFSTILITPRHPAAMIIINPTNKTQRVTSMSSL